MLIKGLDYFLVRRGVRNSELKRTRLRAFVYAFTLTALAAGSALLLMMVGNLIF